VTNRRRVREERERCGERERDEERESAMRELKEAV
jgi:hypothetical protein